MADSKLAFKQLQVHEFDEGITIAERVKLVAPILNQLIRDWRERKYTKGVESFQQDLINRLRKAGLMKKRIYTVDRVGVHPDNRQGAGLVPIDVHDLLQRIVAGGWNWLKVDAMASELPPDEAEEWREFNENLANESMGLLPPIVKENIAIVTARGSHTTAAVRCMEYGSKGTDAPKTHPPLEAGFLFLILCPIQGRAGVRGRNRETPTLLNISSQYLSNAFTQSCVMMTCASRKQRSLQ